MLKDVQVTVLLWKRHWLGVESNVGFAAKPCYSLVSHPQVHREYYEGIVERVKCAIDFICTHINIFLVMIGSSLMADTAVFCKYFLPRVSH